MKTQHTKGPWWHDDDGFITSGHGDNYITIADPNCSKLDIDEREANARLIAAAPDLLNAIEILLIYAGDTEDMSLEVWKLAKIAREKATDEPLPPRNKKIIEAFPFG